MAIILINILFLVFLTDLTSGQSPVVASNVYSIRLDLSIRDSVLDITNYLCGRGSFCDKSQANRSSSICFNCAQCYCDEVCSFYGDCCGDVLFKKDTAIPTQPSPYISCEKEHPKWTSVTEEPYIFMTSSCPAETKTHLSLKSRCEHYSISVLDEATPVTGGRNITYRNKYCALCHGEVEYTEWRFSVECREAKFVGTARDRNDLWKLVLNNAQCTVKSELPNGVRVRNCKRQLIDKCNVTGKWRTADKRTEDLCSSYRNPVMYERTQYKNIFCAACNGILLSREEGCTGNQFPSPEERTFPLSVLIDFNPKPTRFASGVGEITTKCNSTDLYDPIQKRCRPAQCSTRRVFSDGRCETIFSSAKGLGYSGSIYLRYSEVVSVEQWRLLIYNYLDSLHIFLREYTPYVFPKLKKTIYAEKSLNNEQTITGATIEFDFISTSSYRNQVSVEESLNRVHFWSENVTVDNENGTLSAEPLLCGSVDFSDLQTPVESELLPGEIFRLCEDEFCDMSGVTYEPIVSNLNCPHLEYNLSEAELAFYPENSSVEINNKTIHLNKTDYWTCGETLKICSEALLYIEEKMPKSVPDEKVPSLHTSEAMTILSVVCITLSLICLLLTFIVYCMLPQLRTLPGKNTMVLVTYLFCAQLLFQAGIRQTSDEILCRIMGVLIHFLWLVTFMCMGSCAFHMYTVFTRMSSKTTNQKQNENKKLFVYLIVANMLGAVIVAVCVGYHAGISNGTDIGYGGEICFLNKPLDIGVFFALPLGLVLVLDTVCFVRVVLSIRSVPNMTSAKNQSNRNHTMVYFRLSVLLGFTWIVGFVAAGTQIEALWYIFIILNGLQGVFIFVAYCCNRRTIDMLKKRLCSGMSERYEEARTGPESSAVSPPTSSGSHC